MPSSHDYPRYTAAVAAKLLDIHPSHLRTLHKRYQLPIGTQYSAHVILYNDADLDLVRAWRQTHRQGPQGNRPYQVKRLRTDIS